MQTQTLVQIEHDGTGCLKLDIDGRFDVRAFVHVNCGGFSYCQSFDRGQCEELARAFHKAAFLIEQREPQVRDQPAQDAA